eukprot:scaffold150844_cov17-Tisochrysis_lutea.AAC.1
MEEWCQSQLGLVWELKRFGMSGSRLSCGCARLELLSLSHTELLATARGSTQTGLSKLKIATTLKWSMPQ